MEVYMHGLDIPDVDWIVQYDAPQVLVHVCMHACVFALVRACMCAYIYTYEGVHACP